MKKPDRTVGTSIVTLAGNIQRTVMEHTDTEGLFLVIFANGTFHARSSLRKDAGLDYFFAECVHAAMLTRQQLKRTKRAPISKKKREGMH